MESDNAALEKALPPPRSSYDTACLRPSEHAPATHWHLVTCEYPPQLGGVSDYTRLIAEQLAMSGDEVHVWCPPAGRRPVSNGVTLHEDLGQARISDLRRFGRHLSKSRGPRRVLVQWVPHGYGFRSMNLPFCFWLWIRAAFRHDQVEIMVHEPYLAFGEGSWRQDLVALVHRVMTAVLLRSARKVWTSIPAWERTWRPYRLGRKIPFQWLPIPSNVPVAPRPAQVARIRKEYIGNSRFLIGHFGIHGPTVVKLLEQILPQLAERCQEAVVLLIGKGSREFRDKLTSQLPQLAHRVRAAGTLETPDLSDHLAACDLAIQPYPDGISTRRTSAMASLAHGVPLVTTIGHLTEDFWRKTDAVAIVPAFDVAALVQRVADLLDDESERFRMSERARQMYDAEFDVRHVIAALRDTSAS